MLTIKLTEPITHHKADYECAAWWQKSVSNVGIFELELPWALCSDEPMLSVVLPATVTEDYFGSLWCGIPISRYDGTQHAGRRTQFQAVFPVDAFVSDPRFQITPDNLDSVCYMADTTLQCRYKFYKTWLTREMDKNLSAPTHGSSLATAAKLLHDTLERIQEVETFRRWHKNTWRYQAKGQYLDAVWHGYPKSEAAP